MIYKISIILLASGFSKRTGKDDKLLLQIEGKPMLQHAIDLLYKISPLSSHMAFEKIAVSTIDRIGAVHVPEGVKMILNKNPELGQSESIKIGLKTAKGDSYMFMVADQPKLTFEDIKPLLLAAQREKDKIIYPIRAGWPASPTIFPVSFRDELLSLSGDIGGREIRDRYPRKCVGVEVKNQNNFKQYSNLN